MSSSRKLGKKLREQEIVLPIAKGSTPMTKKEIDTFFKQQRQVQQKPDKKVS